MNVQGLKQYSNQLRAAADKLDSAAEELEGIGIDLPGLTSGSPVKRPTPSGARKSIAHPNEFDIRVYNAMIEFAGDSTDTEIRTNDIMSKMGFTPDEKGKFSANDKVEVQKSIKYLNGSNNIVTHGRGRGTFYTVTSLTNSLVAVDPSTSDYRNSGGPTVRQIVRAVFNGLETNEKKAPAEVVKISQFLFPEQNLQRSSFGQVFTNMAKDGELMFEGDGRARVYWRGVNTIDGAADIGDKTFPTFESTDTTSTDTNVTTEDISIVENEEVAVA